MIEDGEPIEEVRVNIQIINFFFFGSHVQSFDIKIVIFVIVIKSVLQAQ